MADLLDPVPGYPRLAHEMGTMPEIATFRRFADLNCQSLLYYQAELIMLERQLRGYEKEAIASMESMDSVDSTDSAKKSRRGSGATDWYWLGVDDPDNLQWKTVLRLRQVLKEYSQLTRNFIIIVDANDRFRWT